MKTKKLKTKIVWAFKVVFRIPAANGEMSTTPSQKNGSSGVKSFLAKMTPKPLRRKRKSRSKHSVSSMEESPDAWKMSKSSTFPRSGTENKTTHEEFKQAMNNVANGSEQNGIPEKDQQMSPEELPNGLHKDTDSGHETTNGLDETNIREGDSAELNYPDWTILRQSMMKEQGFQEQSVDGVIESLKRRLRVNHTAASIINQLAFEVVQLELRIKALEDKSKDVVTLDADISTPQEEKNQSRFGLVATAIPVALLAGISVAWYKLAK